MSFRALAEKSHAGETEPIGHVMRRDEGVPPYRRLRRESGTMSSRALVEKSPTLETEIIVHVMRRDEGVPPYRRLRRESDTMSFRALVEKSPATETKTTVRDSPNTCLRWLTAVAISRKGNVGNEPAPARSPARAPRPAAYYRKTRPHEKTVTLSGLPFRLFQILGKFVESHSEYFKHTHNVI